MHHVLCCCPFDLQVSIVTRYRSCSSDAPFDATFVAPPPCCHAPLQVDAAVNLFRCSSDAPLLLF